jgi:hypothetical protein
MNTDTNIFSKILLNNTLKRSYTMIKLVSLKKCKDNATYANQ